MSRPKAANGDTLTSNAWGIYDAGAFYINDADKWHLVASFPTGVSVRGKCGVMASTVDYEHSRRASWANGYDGVPCKTCEEA
jgi:hypothetical protein